MSRAHWVQIQVDSDLLTAVLRELLTLAANPDDVLVEHGESGRFILARPELAEYWFDNRQTAKAVAPEPEATVESASESDSTDSAESIAQADVVETTTPGDVTEPEPAPVRRGPGRPRKETQPSSASPIGEVS